MRKNQEQTVADILVEYIEKSGVKTAFGVSGAAIAPVWKALSQSSIKTIHCRHESGAVFSASEFSLYKNIPAVVFSTAGPGITNALTGLRAAKLDGAKVIFISSITIAENDNLWGLQQTTIQDVDSLVGTGMSGFFDEVVCVDKKEKIGEAVQAINGMKISHGSILGIFILPHLQREMIDEKEIFIQNIPDCISYSSPMRDCIENQQQEIANILSQGNNIIWNGFGCRHASEVLTRIAIETGSWVMSTPRGKGIFPEKHPLYIGSTGLGSDEKKLHAAIQDSSLKSVLILGTRLGESSSHYLQNELNSLKVYYVCMEDVSIKNNLPSSAVFINAELCFFLNGVYEKIKKHTLSPQLESAHFENRCVANELATKDTEDVGVDPRDVMRAIQNVVIDEYDCLVASDAGNSHVWTNRYLLFQNPNRYRVTSAMGTMGHYASGIVGLAITGETTLAVVGDGSMLMLNEISTAVRHRLPAIWLILNDGHYNMCRQGLKSINYPSLDCIIPRVDFVLFAKSLGADGVKVTQAMELETALRTAVISKKPFVIDVYINKNVQPPMSARNKAVGLL